MFSDNENNTPEENAPDDIPAREQGNAGEDTGDSASPDYKKDEE
jgi:hypothetical protein